MSHEIGLSSLYRIRLRLLAYLAIIVVFGIITSPVADVMALDEKEQSGVKVKLEARIKALENQVAVNEQRIAIITVVAKQIAPFSNIARTLEDMLAIDERSRLQCYLDCGEAFITTYDPFDRDSKFGLGTAMSQCFMRCPQ